MIPSNLTDCKSKKKKVPMLFTAAENVKSTYLHKMENNSACLKVMVSGVVVGRKAA